MEEETCTYCGKPASAHGTYPWDHKPILVSKIIDEAVAELDKPPAPGSPRAKFRAALKAAGSTVTDGVQNTDGGGKCSD